MKKKKLRKLSLDLLESRFQPIAMEELRKIIGGGDGYVSSFSVTDGNITNWTYEGQNYAIYTSNSGSIMVLNGVHVGSNTIIGQGSKYACYWNGEIRIGSGYNTFSFGDLIHEYGHYLQEQRDGNLSYAVGSLGSVWSVVTDPSDHMNKPFEVDATTLGANYATSNYGTPSIYGSSGNPISESEYERLSDMGLWYGGYVDGMGYVSQNVYGFGSGSSGSIIGGGSFGNPSMGSSYGSYPK